MKNSKWVKLVPKEEILKLKKQENFTFSIINLAKHFDVPDKRMSELIRYYEIEITRLTKNKKISKDEWLEECKMRHGNHFDYSMTKYDKLNSIVEIGCPVHGIIEVNANCHKNGSGCKRCNSKETSNFKPLSKEDFIKDAMITHNYYYNYSKVEDFIDTHEKVTIVCPIHGEFKQKVYAHRYGSGCEKCSYIERGIQGRISSEDYFKRVNIFHNHKYNYSKSVYNKMDDEIIITCPHHGDFTQIAKNHLKGGCSSCGKIYSAYSFKKDDNYIEISKSLPSGVYILKIEDFYKIGITNNLHQRITLIKSRMGIDYRPEVIMYKDMSLYEAVKIENILHSKYKTFQHFPNISFEGETECFTTELPIEEIISYLKSL